jgi:hypothetical protein
MKDIPLTTRQLLLPSDIFANELGLMPSPQKIENTQMTTYILIGAIAAITVGFIGFTIYLKHQENKLKRAIL